MPPAKSQTKVELEVNSQCIIGAFVDLIHKGIKSWQAAGALLEAARQKDRDIYAKIIKREPLLSVDMLETIERIGRKEIAPQLLISTSMPLQRLIAYPYDEQLRLCSQPIDVVVSVNNGKPKVENKLVRDLSRLEMKRALGPSGVLTVKEQTALWIPRHSEGNAAWQALYSTPRSVIHPAIQKLSNPAAVLQPAPQTKDTPATAKPTVTMDQLICIGRWVVRQTIGNNCGFERTTATGLNPVLIILDDGIAVIEVVKRKN
jgi:hypothetical protein